MPTKTKPKRAASAKKKPRTVVVEKLPEFPQLVKDLILEQDCGAMIQAQLASDAAMDYMQARAALALHGAHTYRSETMSGDYLYREYPEVGQMQDAWQRMLKIFKEFKLTLKEAGGKKPAKSTSPIIQLVKER